MDLTYAKYRTPIDANLRIEEYMSRLNPKIQHDNSHAINKAEGGNSLLRLRTEFDELEMEINKMTETI